ncbi:hypothetical protein B0T19DRAFT_472787 [Cercophora scortea]|uniref:Zn(2)-C6 fungal-type domain-containing protein n=1 Tax=Cercophora scortea TaxID=314031 RepID=A0AAE0IUZ5_9PEZI|nr:hypothetical protein B0T19DRAFT_472787 [Cercophora scortea]
MERSGRGPRHSGPFGLACTSCSKSKCKCAARADGGGDECQRCHRLGKPCRPSDALRRRAIEKKTNSKRRIAELESKLNLCNVHTPHFQNQGHLHHPNPDTQRKSRHLMQFCPRLRRSHSRSSVEDADHVDSRSDTPKATIVTTSAPPSKHERGSQLDVPEAEAEHLLTTFRSCMLPHFAFMHLPTNLTAQELRKDQPLLFRAIVCAVSPSAARGRLLTRAICEAMMLQEDVHEHRDQLDNNHKTDPMMDLLLALMTFISWGWGHVLNRGSGLSRLMARATSVACEMRLDGPGPSPADTHIMNIFTPDADSSSSSKSMPTRHNFLAQQRAVLGCFVLSSVVSSYYGHGTALRWTPQMEAGLAAIASNTHAANDCPTDATFALQVRLQLLAQQSRDIRHQQQLEQGPVVPGTEMSSLPALIALTALQGQRQEIQLSLSLPFTTSTTPRNLDLVLAHIHAAELTISEATHALYAVVPVMVSQFTRMTSMNGAGAGAGANRATVRNERMQCLWRCVRAAQACASALLDDDEAGCGFRGVSFVQWAQLAQSVVALNRLTTTVTAAEDPAWDPAAARGVVDVSGLLTRVEDELFNQNKRI